MSINNTTKAKSNKHSGVETKEFVERHLHTFNLIEADEILRGSRTSYKIAAIKWLTNFNGALFEVDYAFEVDYPLLKANTDLTRDELLTQLNRKLGVNLEALVSYLNGEKQSIYKNLDEFKDTYVFPIDNIVLTFDDWAKVKLVRYTDNLNHPVHHIYYKLDQFTLPSYYSRNIVNHHIVYDKYLTSIEPSHKNIVATKQINCACTNTYKDEFNKFKVVQTFEVGIGFTDVLKLTEPITVKLNFDIDLYFSHIKYLYKVFQTYK